MTPKIVSEHAERLVREGGVLNRGDYPRYESQFIIELWPATEPAEMVDGTVTVVDVHHANECFRSIEFEKRYGVHKSMMCHEDAELGKWHLVVEPTEDAP